MHSFLVIGSCSSEGPSLLLLVIEVLLAELAMLIWEPEEDCTWLELHHAGMVNGDS